jgi:hypothetical protein
LLGIHPKYRRNSDKTFKNVSKSAFLTHCARKGVRELVSGQNMLVQTVIQHICQIHAFIQPISTESSTNPTKSAVVDIVWCMGLRPVSWGLSFPAGVRLIVVLLVVVWPVVSDMPIFDGVSNVYGFCMLHP